MFDWRWPTLREWRAAATLTAVLACAVGELEAETGDKIQDNLYSVSFASPEKGWVCGSFGTIAATRDGGASWKHQSSGLLEQLFSIDFVDESQGWAVGRSGSIVHTSNGGDTWTVQRSPSKKHLFSVDFVDESFGVAVGDWGVILVTSDGGETWQDHSLSEDVILNSVTAVDRQRVMVAGEIGMVFRSHDGGANWEKVQSGVDKTLFGIRCVSADRCWVVGIDALILYSRDFGDTWEVLNGSTEMRALEQVGFGQAFENPSLYSISVVGQFGVAVGEIGSVFLSHDSGKSWKRLEASKNWALPWFRDLVVLEGQRGAIVGARGRRIMIEEGRVRFDADGD